MPTSLSSAKLLPLRSHILLHTFVGITFLASNKRKMKNFEKRAKARSLILNLYTMRITINKHNYYSTEYHKIPKGSKFIYYNQWDGTILRCTKFGKYGMKYKDPEAPWITIKRLSPLPATWIPMVSMLTLNKINK